MLMIYDLEVTSIRILTMFPYLYSYTESDCWLSYFSCFFLTFTICVIYVLSSMVQYIAIQFREIPSV